MKLLKINILLLLVVVVGCANQLPPTGGLVDRIPPEILSTYPVTGTVNFNDDHLSFEFEEYIDKRSLQEALFISPKIEGKLIYDWSGKSVEIYFDKERLKQNTTYTINIGTDVVDFNNKNKMLNSYIITFSTGDSIDYGEIKGKIFSENKENMMIFAYKDSGSVVNPIVKKPDYITQTGKSGEYLLKGIGFGKYYVFAFSDEMRNLLYNIGEDSYGVYSSDIVLSKEMPILEGINFLTTREDTVKPSLNTVTMTDKNHILIEFSEYIDSTLVNAKNFWIFDSTNNKTIKVKYVFQNSKAKTYYLCISDSVVSNNENYVVADSIFDYSGNLSLNQQMFVSVSELTDTTKPKVNRVVTQFENNSIDYEKGFFTIYFNDAVNIDSIITKTVFLDGKNNKVKINAIKIDDAVIKYEIEEILKPKAKYLFKIDTDLIFDVAGNKIDSVYSFLLNTVNDLSFSGVSGKISSSENSKKIIEVFNKNNIYKQNIKQDNKFEFKRVIPGKYQLRIYEDADSNAVYSFGKVFPLKKSELFFYYPDTLNLRARWPVGDVEINLKN